MLVRYTRGKKTKNTKKDIYHSQINLPDEIIKNIFIDFSPVQLARFSLVCKSFERVAKSFPRLTNIQSAFFNANINILTEKLKYNFEKFLEIINGDLYCLNELSKTIKILISKGAQVNNTGVQFFQPLVAFYMALSRPDMNSSSKNKKKLLKNLILFLLENKISFNEIYTGKFWSKALGNMTLMEYVNQFAKTFPEIVAILDEYNKINHSVSSISTVNNKIISY